MSRKIINCSYKVMDFVQHGKFNKNKLYSNPINQCIDGKTYLIPSSEQLKKYIMSKYPNQSIVLYKIDHNKIKNVNYCDHNQLFLINELSHDEIISQKILFFDVNRINEYFNDLENLEKFDSESNSEFNK